MCVNFFNSFKRCSSGSPWKVEVMAGPAGGGGGEPTRLIPARVPAVFEISTSPGAATFSKNEVTMRFGHTETTIQQYKGNLKKCIHHSKINVHMWWEWVHE